MDLILELLNMGFQEIRQQIISNVESFMQNADCA